MTQNSNRHDVDLDKDFKNLHEKYQAAATELPPKSLDADILRAAHQALESPSTVVKLKPSRRAWFVPVSFVAVLVLSLSVVMKLALEPEYNVPAMSEPVKMESSAIESSIIKMQAAEHKLRAQAALQMTQQIEQRKKMLMRSQSQSQTKSKRAHVESPKAKPESSLAQSAAIMPVADAAWDRDAKIKHLMWLLDLQQFENLTLALEQYRKDYPLSDNKNDLPIVLRNWGKNNLNQPKNQPGK